MKKFRLLDLCCRAGGCSRGYVDAGFDVVGVDIEPQKHYPYDFVRADALEWTLEHWREFDAIHASPHCQGYKKRGKHMMRKDGTDKPQQVHLFREMLQRIGLPYVIENVMEAPLEDAPLFGTSVVVLCGTMFGLATPSGAELQRHRQFEVNWPIGKAPDCRHGWAGVIGVYGGHARDRRRVVSVCGSTPQQNVINNQVFQTYTTDDARKAMNIDWMTMNDLSQAIPPPYAEWIGRRLLEHLNGSLLTGSA